MSFTDEPWVNSFITTTLDIVAGLAVSLGLVRLARGHLPRLPRIRTLLVLSAVGLLWAVATSGTLLGPSDNLYGVTVLESTSTDEIFATSVACHGPSDPCDVGSTIEADVAQPGVAEATGTWIFRNLATVSNGITAFVAPGRDPGAIASTLSSLSLSGLMVVIAWFGLFMTRSQNRARRDLWLINVGVAMSVVVAARLVDVALVDALVLRAGATLWITLIVVGVIVFFLTMLVVHMVIPLLIAAAAVIGAWLFLGSLPTSTGRPTITRGSASHYTNDGEEKRGYSTEWEAREEARRLEAFDGATMNAYQCGESWCNDWHVGHAK